MRRRDAFKRPRPSITELKGVIVGVLNRNPQGLPIKLIITLTGIKPNTVERILKEDEEFIAVGNHRIRRWIYRQKQGKECTTSTEHGLRKLSDS